MKRGRPPAIRSRVAAGTGGRPLTREEADALTRLALLYSGEARRACEADEECDLLPDDLAGLPASDFLARFGRLGDWSGFLDDVQRLLGEYQADTMALQGTPKKTAGRETPAWLRLFRRTLAPHASTDEECADLAAIANDAREVLRLLEESADVTDPNTCLGPVGRLRDRLLCFPPRAQDQLTEDLARALAFEEARARLLSWLHRILMWPTYRASHINDLQTVLRACEDLLAAGITVPKWSRTTARERFKRQLRELYRPEWDTDRLTVWRERIASGERLPPPPARDDEFTREILDALAIPREARPRKG